VVLDIPLLYETKAEQQLDLVLVVSAPADVQQQRVLARPGMTPEKLAAILARQVCFFCRLKFAACAAAWPCV
jgi:dephospho-CoA kinase